MEDTLRGPWTLGVGLPDSMIVAHGSSKQDSRIEEHGSSLVDSSLGWSDRALFINYGN